MAWVLIGAFHLRLLYIFVIHEALKDDEEKLVISFGPVGVLVTILYIFSELLIKALHASGVFKLIRRIAGTKSWRG